MRPLWTLGRITKEHQSHPVFSAGPHLVVPPITNHVPRAPIRATSISGKATPINPLVSLSLQA